MEGDVFMYNIITIERRYASGGNEIGKRLADALGYKLYDRNILMEAAQRLDIPFSRLKDWKRAAREAFSLIFQEPLWAGLPGTRICRWRISSFSKKSVLLRKLPKRETA